MNQVLGVQNWGRGASVADDRAIATEGVPAGILPRAVALAIDLLFATALTALIVVPLTWLIEAVHDDFGIPEAQARALAGFLTAIIWLLIGWLYDAASASGSKQGTLGKRLLGLCVVSESGERLTFGRASVRHCTKFLSAFGLMLGFLMAVFDQRKQTLHDLVAETLVLRRS